ncbi:MAG: winged helix-turn-helix transcriptional regulator, partial [Candidatus Promineifilaceae bacterium]|nr:winged helix-turn-helix transcriptional regulator [Candidatus Promineifilaceae bacterium]
MGHMDFDRHTELQLMEAIAAEPETTQADLATQVGVAVGTVNWYLKRWSAKGYVKVKRMGRWRWRYLLTPQGMREKAELATKYLEASMGLYRRTRADAREALSQVQAAGYERVYIDGDGDIADIYHLTCLELGLERAETPERAAVIRLTGTEAELLAPPDA